MGTHKNIFISGSGRSGTNIMKELLSLHSEVASLPFELRFFVDPRGILDFYNTFPSYWTPYWSDYKIKDLEKFLLSLSTKSVEENQDSNSTPAPYAGWELNKWIPGYAGFVEELIAELVDFKYPGRWPGTEGGIRNNEMYFTSARLKTELVDALSRFLLRCFQAIQSEDQKRLFVNDDTHSFLFAKDLLELMPEAKMIHVVRDPRDVVASLVRQRWAPSDVKDASQWLEATMRQWLTQRPHLNEGQFIEVRFEDLIQKRTKALYKISSFMGIEVEPSLLNHEMSKHNIGRYKADFSQNQIGVIETTLAGLLKEYGYH